MELAEETFLTDDFLRQLINVGEVDILVGLPTHNNAKTVGSIVHAIQSGILRAFPRERAVIINADGGSRDGTPELVTGISIDDVRRASNRLRAPHPALHQHEICEHPGARNCVADDSGGRRFTPRQSLCRDVPRVDEYRTRMARGAASTHLSKTALISCPPSIAGISLMAP